MIAAAGIVVMAGAVIWWLSRSDSNRETTASAANVAANGVAKPATQATSDGTCTPTHCPGQACDACTAANCNVETDGCDPMQDATGRKLCEDAYACFVNPANACLLKGNQGDAIPCWCGKNMTTCWKSNDPATRANGPCVKEVFAAAATTDAATILRRLTDKAYPLGRAINLSTCRGTFCIKECGFP